MRTVIKGFLAFTFVAALALANTANAANIMSFTGAGNGTILGTTVSNTTTLTTDSPLNPGHVLVVIGTIGTGQTNLLAVETFNLVRSNAAASVVNGQIQQDQYTGTITFDAVGGASNILTVTFNSPVFLNGVPGSGSATLSGPASFTAPATSPIVIAGALGGPGVTSATGSFGLTLSNINNTATGTTGLTLTGSTINNFTAGLNSGTFSTGPAIPEPASLVMASIAVFAGLGYHGWHRKASQV
jgi:hypothetical protein